MRAGLLPAGLAACADPCQGKPYISVLQSGDIFLLASCGVLLMRCAR